MVILLLLHVYVYNEDKFNMYYITRPSICICLKIDELLPYEYLLSHKVYSTDGWFQCFQTVLVPSHSIAKTGATYLLWEQISNVKQNLHLLNLHNPQNQLSNLKS